MPLIAQELPLPSNFIPLDKKFGIEIEVYGIGKEAAANIINSVGVECYAENYNHLTQTYWKATTDSSIRSDDDVNNAACEVVSPPLKLTKGNLIKVASVVKALKEGGAKINETCGIHIHVDCRNNNNPDFYRLLLTFYSQFEDKIDMFVHESRRENKNRFCYSNKNIFENWSNVWMEYPNMSARISSMLSGVERYYKLNFCSFTRHGTVEFRQLHGSLNEHEIIQWIVFCVNLVEDTKRFLEHKNTSRIIDTNSLFDTEVEPKKKTFENYAIALFGTVTTNATLNTNANYHQINTFEDVLEVNKIFTDKIYNFSSTRNPNFDKKFINKYFRLFFMLMQEYLIVATNHARNAVANPNRLNYDFCRDINLADIDVIETLVNMTSLFYNFTGSLQERKRKFFSKIKNLGITTYGRGSNTFFGFKNDEEAISFEELLMLFNVNRTQNYFSIEYFVRRVSSNNVFKTYFARDNIQVNATTIFVHFMNEFLKKTRYYRLTSDMLANDESIQSYAPERRGTHTFINDYIGTTFSAELVHLTLTFKECFVFGESRIERNEPRELTNFIHAYKNKILINPWYFLENNQANMGKKIDKNLFIEASKQFYEQMEYNYIFDSLKSFRESNQIVFG